MNKRGLVLLTFLTLVFGLAAWWFIVHEKKRPYNSLPGSYLCDDFGMPDETYNRLRIDGDFKVYGEGKSGTFNVGQLSPKNFSAANLELTMEIVHAPTFNLDPFTTIIFEGIGSRLEIRGRSAEGFFNKYCQRI